MSARLSREAISLLKVCPPPSYCLLPSTSRVSSSKGNLCNWRASSRIAVNTTTCDQASRVDQKISEAIKTILYNGSDEFGHKPGISFRDRRRQEVALPARFERATCGLGNRRSIHLSYGSAMTYIFALDQVAIKIDARKENAAMKDQKPRKAAKSKQSASRRPILERKSASGQVVWKIAVMIRGKRIRQTFKTAEAAAERAEVIRCQ